MLLLRGGTDALEVLLVQRNPQARFMGGVWVFPGGAVDAGEGEGDAAHRVAAVRELQEEAGIVVAVFSTTDGNYRYAVDMEGYGALQFINEEKLVIHSS